MLYSQLFLKQHEIRHNFRLAELFGRCSPRHSETGNQHYLGKPHDPGPVMLITWTSVVLYNTLVILVFSLCQLFHQRNYKLRNNLLTCNVID